MKYQCAAIFAFFVIFHLTNAAPPFDVELFLDELSEINIRMGDLIQRARNEIKANEWKESIEPVGLFKNVGDQKSFQQFGSIEAIVNEINAKDGIEGNFNEPLPQQKVNFKQNEQIGDNLENSTIQSYNLSNRNVGFSQDEKPKPNYFGSAAETKVEDVNTDINDKSVTGYVSDVIGNQMKNWIDTFGRKKYGSVREDNLQESANAQNDEFNQSQSNDLTEQESERKSSAQPMEITNLDNQENINQENINQKNVNKDGVNQEDIDKEQLFPIEIDQGHDWGEETNNNEGEVDEGGWFGNAINSIVDFFS